MNAPIPILSGNVAAAARHGHLVQFYDEDGWLLDQLCGRLAPVLAAGHAVVIIATKLHRDGLKQRLKRRGIALASAIRESRYLELDAAEAISRILRYDRVDSARFREVVAGLVRPAQGQETQKREVVVFGEMVALLCADGKRDAAIYLEQLWNAFLEESGIELICAYPMSCFGRAGHDETLSAICAEHGATLPAESYLSLGEAERSQMVIQLQQRTQALENEIRIAEQRAALIQAAAGLGTWEMDMTDESVALSVNAQRLLGLASGSRIALAELLRVMCYSGDRDVFVAAVRKARTGRKEFSAEFRVQASGEVRVLTADGKLFYNNGQPVLIGVVRDTTASQDAVA